MLFWENGAKLTIPKTVVVYTKTLDELRVEYEAGHDLKTLLAYGRGLDSGMITMDSIRAELQKTFFRELAKEAGMRYNIKWNILYGLWMRESTMNPKAKGDGKLDVNGRLIPNSFRAFGLGQAHLATARAHYDSSMTEERLLDPIENGMCTAKILRDYADMFGGKIRYGISAYQQGPTATKEQITKKIQLKNILYILDVLQFAAEVQ